MKIALAPSYRMWMFALLPTTFGLGTAVLWLMSLKWPLSVDEDGLTLRGHQRVDWRSIERIRVSRSYVDGHVSHIRIYHESGTSEIRLGRLRHGQDVARIILAMFARENRLRAQRLSPASADSRRPTGQRRPGKADTWAQELAMLGKTLAAYPEGIRDSMKFAKEEI